MLNGYQAAKNFAVLVPGVIGFQKWLPFPVINHGQENLNTFLPFETTGPDIVLCFCPYHHLLV